MPRKLASPSVSVDQAIKELLQLHPDDTLAFLLPEVPAQRGAPTLWRFHNVHVRKKDLLRKGLVMDLNIEYHFQEGAPLLLVLVEHWSTARSVDLVRTAQYYLDLASRFPDHEIVPVALITEIDASPVPDGFSKMALGTEVIRFVTRVVQLSQTQAQDWVNARNLVASALLMAMGGTLSRPEKLRATIDYFLRHDENETRLLFPLISEVGKLNTEEHAMTIKYLTQLPKPLFMTMLEEQAIASGMAKGMAKGLERGLEQGLERGIEQGIEQGLAKGLQQGLEQGIQTSKRDDARKMREHGISWDVITDITGLKPEDLQS